MTRRLFVFAAALLIDLVVVAQSQPPPPAPLKNSEVKQPHSAPKQEQVGSNEVQATPSITVINQLYKNPEGGNEAQAGNRQDNGSFDETLTAISTALLALFTLVLAGATGALCYVAVLQRQTMIEHKRTFETMATHMEGGLEQTTKAADAALLNATAVMNADRAWIVVLPHIWSPELYPQWEQGDPAQPTISDMRTRVHNFPAQIKNVGRTPARVDEIAIHYIHTQTNPVLLDEEPDYGELSKQDGYVLVPNDEILADSHLATNGGILRKTEIASIHNQGSFLYVYGIVRYRDVYERRQVTTFGYVYHFPQGGAISFQKAAFRRAGPSAYNRAT